MRTLFWLLVCLLPKSPLKNRLLNRHRRWSVAPDARIGFCMILDVDTLIVGPGAKIGTGSVVRNLGRVELGEHSSIGQFNWISAATGLHGLAAGAAEFFLGRHAVLTNRHYVDCSGGVSIGEFTHVAGVRTTLITHGIDLGRAEQGVAPIRIGRYCLVSSTCQFVPGAVLPDYTMVGMGATITAHNDAEPYTLLVGSPARVKKHLDPESAYFTRTVGRILPGSLEPAPAAPAGEQLPGSAADEAVAVATLTAGETAAAAPSAAPSATPSATPTATASKPTKPRPKRAPQNS
jgi:acetyltransferase-like isoleucine patch superfamily enzyme